MLARVHTTEAKQYGYMQMQTLTTYPLLIATAG